MIKQQSPTFFIEEMKPEDIEKATKMRVASWLDTYVNEDYGVSREWVMARNEQQLSPEIMKKRIERYVDSKQKGLSNAWVAKSESGDIIGAATPYSDERGVQRVGSLYVAKEWHGTGVGAALMQKVIEWWDPRKPIELEVATYNERAKAFYKKWGFEEIPGSENVFADTIPEIRMIRKGDKQ